MKKINLGIVMPTEAMIRSLCLISIVLDGAMTSILVAVIRDRQTRVKRDANWTLPAI